jgi:hypothetical protein
MESLHRLPRLVMSMYASAAAIVPSMSVHQAVTVIRYAVVQHVSVIASVFNVIVSLPVSMHSVR